MISLALCQFNPTVGALNKNAPRLLDYAQKAAQQKVTLILTPELSLCGYPLKDLVFDAGLLLACDWWLSWLSQETPIPMIVGAPFEGFNAAFWCYQGEVKLVARKRLLPNYQVFDERRYFRDAAEDGFHGFDWRGKKFGVTICEDAWGEETFWPFGGYEVDPVQELAEDYQVDFLINMAASPFEQGKPKKRLEMFQRLAKRYAKPVVVVGQVGANDGLIFDGGSVVLGKKGEVLIEAKAFQEELITCKL
ncbi:MAG: hypothetical protein JKY15_02680 [Deltaproteobacteria bacterium]|nr:hypothetical protein [Deltaproteobacteria bacterium]